MCCCVLAETEEISRAPLLGWHLKEKVLSRDLKIGDFIAARDLLPDPPHGPWQPDRNNRGGGVGHKAFRRYISEGDDGEAVRMRITCRLEEGVLFLLMAACAFSRLRALVRVSARMGVGGGRRLKSGR